jgi:hypothetical protein
MNVALFERIYREIGKHDVYSDTIASNIWAYMGSKARVYFGYDGIALNLYTDYTNESYYTVLAGSGARDIVRDIARSIRTSNETMTLKHVSSETTHNLREWSAVKSVVGDRDNYDYIYSVNRLIDFDNRHLRRRAKEIARLRSEHPGVTFRMGTQRARHLSMM